MASFLITMLLTSMVFSTPVYETPCNDSPTPTQEIFDKVPTETPEIVSTPDYCSGTGAVIANGTQQRFQTCSQTVQGSIPSFDNMVSTVIIFPSNAQEFASGSDINVVIKSVHIEYGYFDDPATLYYVNPQSLNAQGDIKGHNHITFEKLTGPETEGLQMPDARIPVFFKGLNSVAVNGELSVTIPGDFVTGEGVYRICSAVTSSSHAPVIMPVAKRGFSDDCIRVSVKA